MGLLSGLIGLLGQGAEKPIKAASELYTTDKARIAEETKHEEVAQRPQLAQLENNRLMVLSKYFFESAWPSLTGWTVGACVALYYVPQLIITNILWAEMCFEHQVIYPFPIAPDDILNLVYLLFGFGAYHLVKRKMFDK